MEYFGFIEEIKDDIVVCRLQERDSLYINYLDLPKNEIDREYLVLGRTFILYTVTEPEWIMDEPHNSKAYRIEWTNYPDFTDEEIKEAYDKAERLSRELKWE